jgi:hypothetical protein
MPTFITYASYSQAGIKGIVDKPTSLGLDPAGPASPAALSNI